MKIYTYTRKLRDCTIYCTKKCNIGNDEINRCVHTFFQVLWNAGNPMFSQWKSAFPQVIRADRESQYRPASILLITTPMRAGKTRTGLGKSEEIIFALQPRKNVPNRILLCIIIHTDNYAKNRRKSNFSPNFSRSTLPRMAALLLRSAYNILRWSESLRFNFRIPKINRLHWFHFGP